MPTICFISRTCAPHDTRIWQEIIPLPVSEYSVHVICKQLHDEPKNETVDNVTYRRLYKVDHRKFGFGAYLIDSLLFMIRAFPVLVGISLKTKIDAIVVHTLPEFLIFITVFHKLTGTKVLLDGRDFSVDLVSSRWAHKKISVLKSMLILLERLSCSLADTVFVASHGFMERLVGRGIPKEKLVLLMNTADPVIFKPDTGRLFKPIDSDPKLIYHGTVAERFGVIVAVRAIAKLREEFPGATLHVYGFYDSDYRRQIEEVITGKNLERNVFLEQPRSLREIAAIIKTMDMGLVTYLDLDFMNVALSTKTFEYVASGLPVVASRLRSTLSVFSESSICYAEPGNENDFADKIQKLCTDAGLRRRYSENALREYASVSGEVMGERFLTAIKKCCTKR